jgi:hypothetical protein
MYEIDVKAITNKIENERKALIIYSFTSVGGAVLAVFCSLALLQPQPSFSGSAFRSHYPYSNCCISHL